MIGGRHLNQDQFSLMIERWKKMTLVRIQRRIDFLKDYHLQLKKQIQEGMTNYLDDPDLKKLKWEKLHVKNELYRLQLTLDKINENCHNN